MKIIKIITQQLHLIFIILILLVMQAMCDLKLPEYTSDIVNVGIQQGGIKDSVFDVITESEFNKIKLFLKNENEVKSKYKLLSKDNLSKSKYKEYIKDYPLLSKENIYILKDISLNDREALNESLSKSTAIVSILESDFKQVKELKDSFKTNDIFSALLLMPNIEKEKIISNLEKEINKMEDSIILGISVNKIKSEYKKIGIDTDSLENKYIISMGIKMVLIAFIAMLIMIIISYLASKVGAKFSKELRSKVVNKVMDYSEKEVKEFGSASLITRSTNDIAQVQMFIIILLRMVLYAPIIGIGAFIKIRGNEMGFVIGIAILSIILIVGILFGIALPKFKILQKLIDRLNLVSKEILTGIPVIRAFATEKHEETRFDTANINLTKANLFVNRIMTFMMPSMMFVMNGVSVLIIWVGASKIDQGVMQVGTMLAFITYTMQIIMAFLMLSMISIILPRALVSAKRVSEILNTESSIKEIDNPIRLKNMKGTVEFKDVYFRYPDAEEDVIKNLSFTAHAGTTTAFVGSTGAGKSSIVNLIPRFFDATGGKILIDGENIKNISLHDLRANIGYSLQKGRLFTGTIDSNIKFAGENLSAEEVEKAAEISQVMEFINQKPEKFNTEIAEGGTNVSGGQKQRLSIARAIVKKPKILIFDDSFSALDYKTDSKLRKALKQELKDSCIFIVAQRISTIMHADNIIVIEDGMAVGSGTHEQLIKNCEVYKEIALSQLSKEELENEK